MTAPRITFEAGKPYAIVDSRLTSRFIRRRMPDGTTQDVPLDYHVATMRPATDEEVECYRKGNP